MKITLPPFETLRNDFDEVVSHRIATQARGRGILAEIKAHIIHEGKSTVILREDGTAEETKMMSAEATSQMSHEEIEKISIDTVLRKIGEMANQFQEHQTRTLIETMNDATEKTGNVVDGKGQPLTAELIMASIEKMQHDFDENGEPTVSLLIHPNMLERIKQLDLEFNNDPELQKKFDDLMARKRDEFRSREMDRDLAG